MRKYRLQNRNGQGSMFSSLDVDMVATVDVFDVGPGCRVLVTFGYQITADAVKMHAVAHAEAAAFVGVLYEMISTMRDEEPNMEFLATIETLASGGPRGMCGQTARVEIRGRDAIALAECGFAQRLVDFRDAVRTALADGIPRGTAGRMRFWVNDDETDEHCSPQHKIKRDK